MSFKIEVKPDFLSLRWGLDSFGADGIQELTLLIAKYPEDHMIINFLSVEEFYRNPGPSRPSGRTHGPNVLLHFCSASSPDAAL